MQRLRCKANYLIYHQTSASFKLSHNCSLRLLSTITTSERSSRNEIRIPKAIKRGPTDILETLSSLVKTDYTGPLYKYIDDPFLTPVSNVEKRSYSLAKEAGRKAALYFFDKYPQLFYRDISEPKIDGFTFKEIYDDSMEFEELDLAKCIMRNEVSNAIVCYASLTKQNKPITEETLLDLLDLVSFSNCEDPLTRFPEEDWFKKTVKNPNENMLWKDGGFAEVLFESLPNKTSRAYSSIIQGMCRHFQSNRAFAFYQQASELGLKLNVHTFNGLISRAYTLQKPTTEEKWMTVVDLLQTMQQNGIKPNIGTLNEVLHQISRYKYWNQNRNLATNTLNEFAFKFGITPSLATYSHLINIFYRTKGPRGSVIYEIIDKINAQTLVVQDLEDVNFFYVAMDICSSLNDVDLVYKLHSLAEKNIKLLGRGANQNGYFFNFFRLLCSLESIENFMIIYSKYVPNTYTPSVDLTETLLKTINMYKAFSYLPQIWNDIVLFGYCNRIELIQTLLLAMSQIGKGDPLCQTFNNLVVDIVKKVDSIIAQNAEKESLRDFQWTAKCLSYCISILVKADNIEFAFEIVRKLEQLKDELLDVADTQSLVDFCNFALSIKQPNYAIYCLKYCQEMDRIDVISAVMKEIENVDSIDDKIRNEIKNMV